MTRTASQSLAMCSQPVSYRCSLPEAFQTAQSFTSIQTLVNQITERSQVRILRLVVFLALLVRLFLRATLQSPDHVFEHVGHLFG